MIISKQFPPAIGGGGAHAYYLATSLAQMENINVDLITDLPQYWPTKTKYNKMNLTIHRIKFEHSVAMPYEPTINTCLDLINSNDINPHIIHAHHIDGTYLSMHLSSSFNIPLIVTIHKTPIEWDNTITKRSPKYSCLKLFAHYKSINTFIAGSKIFYKELRNLGVKSKKIRLVYHGVPINTLQRLAYNKDNINSVKRELNLQQNEILLICPSRLDRRKKIDVFVNAAGLLQQEMNDKKFKFVITGHPDSSDEKKYYKELMNIANTIGIKDQVYFKTFEFKELMALYGLSHACILPSSREGLGLVVLESLAIRTPVIVSQGIGVNEIICKNEKHGLVFLSDDYDDLKNQIKRIIVDEHLKKTIKGEGFRRVRELFNSEKMAKKYVKMYKKLI